MQSSNRASPFHNCRNIEKPARNPSAKQRYVDTPSASSSIRNPRDYESIKTLYRKQQPTPTVIGAAAPPASRPSTYTKANEAEDAQNYATGDSNADVSNASCSFLYEQRSKPMAQGGESLSLRCNVPKPLPPIHYSRAAPPPPVQLRVPNTSRTSTPIQPSSTYRNARKQIRANLELYFRKKELANRYAKQRPSSASSVKIQCSSPRSGNAFLYSENQRYQRNMTLAGFATKKPPHEPTLTVIGTHIRGSKPLLKRNAYQSGGKAPSPVTTLSSDEYFDCQKVCSVESYKLVAEKDTTPAANAMKINKVTRKTPSKSRINTHWSFGPPPSDTLAMPKLICLDPVFLGSPRRQLTNQRPRLVNRFKRPSKTMTTTMMIPSHRPIFHDTSMQTDIERESTPNSCANSAQPSASESTSSQQQDDPNFQYSISRRRSSVQLKISNQFLIDHPQVVMSKAPGSETYSMSIAPAPKSPTIGQANDMGKGDFISFDYDIVDSDEADSISDDVKAVPEVTALNENGSQTDEAAKGKDIVERLACFLRCGDGDACAIGAPTVASPVEVVAETQSPKSVPAFECREISTTLADYDAETDVFSVYSGSSSDSEANATVLEKTMIMSVQVREKSPDRTSKSTLYLDSVASDEEVPVAQSKVLQLSATTSTTTIAEPISSVRFPVRLNQPAVQRLCKRDEAEDPHFDGTFPRTNPFKRIGLVGIYGVLFMVMFTALALPDMQCE